MSAKNFVKLVIVMFFFSGQSVIAELPYSKLIVFGDSLSDTGNIAGVVTPNLPRPYFDNRISNGPLAVDRVAGSLGLNASAAAVGGDNFAVVGGNILGNDLGDLRSQVTRYLERERHTVDESALFLVFVGGNDLRDLRSITSLDVAEERIRDIASVLVIELERLSALGAKSFLVANSADIGRIPQTLALESSSPGIALRSTGLVQRYNTHLLEAVRAFATRSNAQVRLFDVFSALNKILDAPGLFGFDVVDVGCFDPADSINPFDFEFDAGCDSGFFPFVEPNFDGYAFFDSIHPSTATHQLVGTAMIERLQAPPISAGVPQESITAVLSAVMVLLFGD